MPTYCYSHPLMQVALILGAIALAAVPAWGQTGGTNYLYGIQGTVVYGRYLIRPDRAYEGAVLSPDHQIRVEPNGGVTLACSNGGSYPLRAGTYRVVDYCPAATSRRSGPRNPSRDPFNTALPYVVSPRNTALLTADNLTLRWHPVPNATHYQVTISGRGVNWTTTVNQPEVTYTGTAVLQPDYRYNVVIATNSNLSSATDSTVGLTVLPPEEVARVTRQVTQIEALNLQPDVEAIALALLYSRYEHSDPDRHSYALNQLALDTLQQRIDASTDNSQIYLLQADTYLTIGLPLLARDRYLQALELAEGNYLREQQAQSHIGLGIISAQQTEYRDAISHLEAAQSLYEELGDRDQAAELQTRIDRLSSQVP